MYWYKIYSAVCNKTDLVILYLSVHQYLTIPTQDVIIVRINLNKN